MNIDRSVMAFAGSVILVSIVLVLLHSAYWIAADGYCRCQPSSGGVYRVLSPCQGFKGHRIKARCGV